MLKGWSIWINSSARAVFGILAPTTPILLWPKAEPYPQPVAGREPAPRAGAVYTIFVNVVGCAGLSLPAAVVNKRNPAGKGTDRCEADKTLGPIYR